MIEKIQIRLGGYGPPSTSFSRGLRIIGDKLALEFGNRVDIQYVWNVMDLGYAAEAEEITARQQIEDAGCEVIELTDAERQAFQAAVQPVYRETQDAFGGKTVAEILGAR